MEDVNAILLAVILHVNELNTCVKIKRFVECILKNDQTLCCP